MLNITTTDCQIIDLHKELDEWAKERGYNSLNEAVEALRELVATTLSTWPISPTPPVPLPWGVLETGGCVKGW